MRRILRGGAKKRADSVRGRSDFFDDFFELFDHPARFDHRFLLIENLRPQFQQVAPNRTARRQRRNHPVE